MCGIAAVHDLSGHTSPERVREVVGLGEDMLSRLHHRGPDDHGSRVVGRTWLGHTRLSIVDLAGGRQPLPDATGRRWVVANGEIYHHEELRDRLPGPFTTRSDSEVVLHVLGALGTDGIHVLGGMCGRSASPTRTAGCGSAATRWAAGSPWGRSSAPARRPGRPSARRW